MKRNGPPVPPAAALRGLEGVGHVTVGWAVMLRDELCNFQLPPPPTLPGSNRQSLQEESTFVREKGLFLVIASSACPSQPSSLFVPARNCRPFAFQPPVTAFAPPLKPVTPPNPPLQLREGEGAGRLFWNSSVCICSGGFLHRCLAFHCSLFRGLGPLLTRACCSTAAQFTAYEVAKTCLVEVEPLSPFLATGREVVEWPRGLPVDDVGFIKSCVCLLALRKSCGF